MTRFTWDFAGFVGGAVLCSLPVMAFITVTVYDRATERRVPPGIVAPMPTPSPTMHGPVKPGIRTLSESAAKLCGVDPALFWALILRESSGRHYAEDGSVLRSSAGAVGAAQVLPSTALEMGLDARDPWQNLLAGACALRGHWEASGSWETALHSYHAGRWRKRTTAKTRAYASDILGSAQ